MIATVNNQWELLPENITINGLRVRRASNSVYPIWSKPNEEGKSEVIQMVVSYYIQELYPNGKVCKDYVKSYTLENLAETDIDSTHYMAELRVLDSFIASLGQNNIVTPIQMTLANPNILPVDAPDGYPLHLNTRQILER